MKNMNLLPEKIIQCKKARKRKIMMVISQVAIFLCLGIISLFLRNREQNMIVHSHELSQNIAAYGDDPLLLIMELERARAMARHFPPVFEPVWVETILELLPNNASITQLSYSRSEIVLSGEAGDISDVGTYVQKLLGSELFNFVDMDSIVLLEDGLYSYELRIRVNGNEE